jgi:hypothetical protein
MGLLANLKKAVAKRWRIAFRNTDSGRFITREQYDDLPEEDRARVRFRLD